MNVFIKSLMTISLSFSLIGCGNYPHLSSVPEKPVLRLTPQSQNTLKDQLQKEWEKAEEKHAQNP